MMMLPLMSPIPESNDGQFLYVECCDDIPLTQDDVHSRSCTPRTSSPGYRMELPDYSFSDESFISAGSPHHRMDNPDLSSFKRLFEIINDKVQLLTDQSTHLKEEIAEKNETINKLLDFMNKIVRPKEADESDDQNDSVDEYNKKVTEHNLMNQQKNITTRKRRLNNSDSLNQPCQASHVPSPSDSTPQSDEILFLRNEIENKNRIIDFLIQKKTGGSTYRLIIDEDEDEDDENEDDDQRIVPEMDDDFHDNTLEVMERLLINDITIDSISKSDSEVMEQHFNNERTFNSILNVDDRTIPSISEDDVLEATKGDKGLEETSDIHKQHDETKEPEEEPTNDELLNIRIDKVEQMILDMKTSHEMLTVAPWDQHSNGFASNYMVKNGHEPGKGLGKTGEGIVEPIRAEKNTLDATIDVSSWKSGTILIAGASILQGLDETKMSRTGRVKVRSHGGATIKDMRDHLNAHLRKKPDRLILHVHSNDASSKETSADDMFDRLIDLKTFAEGKVPNLKVTFSCPILREDNVVANAKQVQLKNRLRRSGLEVIVNDNIEKEDLGRKGLHLRPSGSSKLAKNIISYLKSV